jgi:hypothetical protein
MAVVSLTRKLLATLAVAVAALGLCLIAASPAAAAGGGYVRLAHLVPDKIACDMYLQLHSVTGDVVKFLPSVQYGTVSDYVMVPAGTYAVAMRGPGAAAKSTPVLSTVLTVADGHAYTVGRMGSPEHAEAKIIEDDRTMPTGDQAKLRVVQAAQRMLDVTVADGPVVRRTSRSPRPPHTRASPPARRRCASSPPAGRPPPSRRRSPRAASTRCSSCRATTASCRPPCSPTRSAPAPSRATGSTPVRVVPPTQAATRRPPPSRC